MWPTGELSQRGGLLPRSPAPGRVAFAAAAAAVVASPMATAMAK